MTNFIKLFTASIFFFSIAANAQKVPVKIKFTHTKPYCGGARPSEAMQQDAMKLRPYAGKKMIAVSDKKTDSCITDKKGVWSKKLPPGEYKFYTSWQYHHAGPQGKPVKLFNKDCLKEEWDKPVFVYTVKAGETKTAAAPEIRMRCDHQLPCWIEQPPVPE
jgi:hypothetical protein